MSKTSKRIISGSIAGAAAGLFMEVLRRGEYITSYSITIKSIIAGALAIAMYTLTMLVIRLSSSEAPPKA